MKNLLLCSVILCLLISCSTDSDLNPSEHNESSVNTSAGNLLNPANKANPFDSTGKKYYDALIHYRQQNEYPNSIAQMSKQIRFIASQFKNGQITSKNVIPFTDEIVESIMADPDNSMIAIVEDSALSNSAKTNLINFLQGLITQRSLGFSISYEYIVDYEDTVIVDNALSEDDSETILTVTSISRYSLYSEVERKDHDWDKSSGNKNHTTLFATDDTAIISVIALLDILE